MIHQYLIFLFCHFSTYFLCFMSLSLCIGLKGGYHEKEDYALELLRIIWGDIAKKSKKDIDDALRGPPDKNQANKPQTKLQSLISERIVSMHIDIHNIIKQMPATDKDHQVLQLQKRVSEHIAKMHVETNGMITAPAKKQTYSSRILFLAAETGNTKFVVELIRRYPDLIWKVNDDKLSIFHIAVKHRHQGIYNLLYEIGSMKDLITPLKDEKQNNMLHYVGKQAKRKRLEDVSGVALQMQRELLWFKLMNISAQIRESIGLGIAIEVS
ncbi:putative ankyrin repeat-containing domain superfamily [Helianthus anomalus]